MIVIILVVCYPAYFVIGNRMEMILDRIVRIRNRKQAGTLLAGKLLRYNGLSAKVVGIPYGAVVGFHLAT